MKKRKPINQDDEAKVLTTSRRRCCVCWALENNNDVQQGQIAHLDRNPSNSKLDNLVYLCLRHHDQYDTRTSQSKGFTETEVRKYREELHKVYGERYGSQPFYSFDGMSPAGKRFVTFPVAFPSTPTVLVTPISEKPCSYSLSGLSTTGFTVNIWGDKNEQLDDISFSWMAYLRD